MNACERQREKKKETNWWFMMWKKKGPRRNRTHAYTASTTLVYSVEVFKPHPNSYGNSQIWVRSVDDVRRESAHARERNQITVVCSCGGKCSRHPKQNSGRVLPFQDVSCSPWHTIKNYTHGKDVHDMPFSRYRSRAARGGGKKQERNVLLFLFLCFQGVSSTTTFFADQEITAAGKNSQDNPNKKTVRKHCACTIAPRTSTATS